MIFLLIITTLGHQCIFNEINKNIKKSVLPTLKSARESSASWHPLRFSYDLIGLTDQSYASQPWCKYAGETIVLSSSNIYKCSEDDVLTKEKIEYIDRLFQSLNQSISEIFNVHTINYNKVIPGKKQCGEAVFPRAYTIPEESDFHIMVTSHPHTSSSVFAYAAACYYGIDSQVNKRRSLMGYVNIVTSALEPTEERFRDQVGIIFHETMHALGFDGSLGVDKKVGNLNLKVVEDEVVVVRARKHFGCDNMTYVPLEDGGGPGTANAHWERRIFISEIMNGITSNNPRISEITLAYFEALGVYKPNYEMADALSWGRGVGCSFLEDCSKWPKQNGYYCRTGVRRCTNDRSAIGICDGNSFKETLNQSYQHYGDPHVGGSDEIADNCIFVSPIETSYCYKKMSLLSFDYYFTLEMLNHGQNFGDTSMCFESSLIKFIPYGINNYHCYSVACMNNSFYKISIDGRYYDCDKSIKVRGYGGKLICADPKDICGNRVIETWPEIDSVENKTISVGDILFINGRNLDVVQKVYIDYTSCKIINKSKEQLQIEVDYRDPFISFTSFEASLMVKVNESVNSCYDHLIKIKVPYHYIFLNFGDWVMTNYIFIAVIPVWILFFILLFGYYILKVIVIRQAEEVHEAKREINLRLNKFDNKPQKKKQCFCVMF
ncbi:hypothetical protein, conserved [Entamoeba dispar SAW760]|uniref:IPT/TIG domain-containing protein n=1 Tax=Entamoeba dispar (strain ATCC PRA-260 / SAW760) TaxID=370354 RepID=B0ERK0_ENTDS|nr:uncharacterized protein EDI_037980 [Entamoeba dispar SAW760]EDR22858.1 hypothetical protein, conserved [Entamoeba dispar SAW760]|eukprot:EDR22858.1 hypothetical protein, conserved [Entamoeba dispar SAW760]